MQCGNLTEASDKNQTLYASKVASGAAIVSIDAEPA